MICSFVVMRGTPLLQLNRRHHCIDRVVNASLRDDSSKAAMDLLDEMSEAGLAMDAFTYAHAIEACCNGGNRVRAHETLT